jgi:uncharacterized protein YndB with AHSA1/START domain
MRIHQEVMTRATPERAWALVSDPRAHGTWNPRIVRTEFHGSAVPGLGVRYRVAYELSGKTTEFEAEIVEFSPPTRFGVRLEERWQNDPRHVGRFVLERYVIRPHGSGTRVAHDVHVHDPGMPFLVRALVWLIMRVGRPTGQTYMQRFAELAEADAERAA